MLYLFYCRFVFAESSTNSPRTRFCLAFSVITPIHGLFSSLATINTPFAGPSCEVKTTGTECVLLKKGQDGTSSEHCRKRRGNDQ